MYWEERTFLKYVGPELTLYISMLTIYPHVKPLCVTRWSSVALGQGKGNNSGPIVEKKHNLTTKYTFKRNLLTFFLY